MLVKPNWDSFKAKFSENPQNNFEWFCYILFSKEYNQPYGTHRYKNQSGIENDPIEVNGEVIGWQSKFYEDTLSSHKEDLLGTLTKTKRDNPNITKIILYTNSEWGQGQGTKEPKAKTETEEKAKELNIELVWRTRSYFESPFVCQEQKDISGYFFELNQEWKFSNNGFINTLKEKYEQDFKTISLLTDNKKCIEDIFINISLIDDSKKENIKKIITKESFLDKDDFPHDEDDFIDISSILTQSSKSLIYGTAGIGKTTLCKNISYRWAKGHIYTEFEYVIYIPLRQWRNDGIKGAIKDYYYSLDDKQEITLDLEENSDKILFLFDGYDELNDDKKKDLDKEINEQKLKYFIVTSRPYGYKNSNFLGVNKSFETVGFTPSNVNEYIDNFFQDKQKAKNVKNFLDSNMNIKVISYIPLMLEMICIIWEEEFSDKRLENISFSSMTMTKLYQEVIEYLLKGHSQKNRNDLNVSSTRNRKKIEKYLSKLAFLGLEKQKILFDYDFLEKVFVEDSEIEFFESNIINSGFLKSDRTDEILLDNNFEFLHLTFQEYFSAVYVSTLDEEEQRVIISKYKFYPHFQVFFAFLSGLIENKTLLFEEISNEPKDIFGLYELLFMMTCLSEIAYENLDSNIVKLVNQKLQTILEMTFREDMNYEVVLENFKLITHIINNGVIEYLFEVIELNEDEYLEESIINTFLKLIKYDKKYQQYLEKIELKSNNEDIQEHIYQFYNKKKKTKEEITFNSILVDLNRLSKKISNISAYVYETLYSISEDTERDIEIENSIIKILQKYNINKHMDWIKNNFDEIEADGRICLVAVVEGKEVFELKIKEQFLDKKRKNDISLILSIINQNDKYNSIIKLVKLIKENNLDEDELLDLFYYFKEFLDDEKIINFLIDELWEDKNIDEYIKSSLVDLIQYVDNNKVTDIIFEAFYQDIYYAEEHFVNIKRYDDEYIDKFIKLLDDERFYESFYNDNGHNLIFIAESFSEIASKNFYAHTQLMKFFKNENNSEIMDTFDDTFLKFYLYSLKTSILFKEYNEGEYYPYLIFINISHNNKALFVDENNKLCTIEDGEKISTKRDVTDEFLIELDSLFNGDVDD